MGFIDISPFTFFFFAFSLKAVLVSSMNIIFLGVLEIKSDHEGVNRLTN